METERRKSHYSFLQTVSWLLYVGGIKKNEYGDVPITFRSLVLMVWVFALFFAIILKLFCCVASLELFVAGIMVAAITFHLVVKQFILIIKRKEIISLIDNLEHCFLLARTDPKFIEEKSLSVKRSGKKLIIAMGLSIVVAFGFQYINHELTGDTSLPVEMWTPNGDEGTSFTVLIYQLFVGVGCATELVIYYALFLGLVSTCRMIIDSLKGNFIKGPDEKETLEAFISRNVLAHAHLLKVVDDINANISPIVFLEILLSSIQCCCAGYLANFDSFHNSLYFVYVQATLVMPGMICFLGQEIKNYNQELFDQLYDSPWYIATPKQRRYYLMMIAMTSKPLILHFRFLMTFDLERYANVLQAAYSYITILQNLLN